MKVSKVLFSVLFLLVTTCCFGKGYEVIENKATLPLLDPTFSDRKVVKIQLENGLQACLISDPETKQSAASLSVEVGSWNNPEKYPGMAHFLEHMLFMGTHTYPEERSYWQYIRDHGGLANAFTASDRTVYYFTINNDWFEGAVDRFSHFFIDPLLSTNCIDRELHAVDQEYANSIEHDGWREAMIFKETGNPQHPNRHFSCGNAEILSKIPQEVLKKWYETHYSAKLMHLIVVSPLPIEKLIQLTTDHFSEVPSFTPNFKRSKLPLTSSKQKGHMTYIAPIKDLRQLNLSWEVPHSFNDDFETRAPHVAAIALAHEGEQSLISQLKREQLAEGLSVVCDPEGKHESLFRISIDLTHQGLAQIDTVIERCFQAISRLKTTGIPSALFEDIKKVATLNYQHQSRVDLFRFMYSSGYTIVDEDLATYPEKTNIPTAYNPGTITSFIQTLTPQNCLYTVIADPALTSIKMENTERWMAAEYTVKEIPQSKLVSWQEANLHPDIDLPGINPFLPDNVDIVAQNDTSSSPKVIYQHEDGKVYFKVDDTHLVPEIALFANIKSPQVNPSAQSNALLDLFVIALHDHLRTSTYFAKEAGYSIHFGNEDFSLALSVNGFNDKAPLLIKEIFGKIKTLKATPEQFELYKQLILTEYDNASKELPLIQARDLVYSVVTNASPISSEKLQALKSITFDDFNAFSKDFAAKTYVEATIAGNLTQQSAQALWSEVKELLQSTPYPPKEHLKKQVLSLQRREGPYIIKETTLRQGNGVILLLEQGAFSFEKRAAQEVLGNALQEAFFDTLRTKQQTGYIAQSWAKEEERHLFQFFGVQSSTHATHELLARFELFLEDFLRNFEEALPESRVETIKTALITQLTMPPKNLHESASITHHLGFHYDGDFNWRQKRADAIKELSYDKLRGWAEQCFSRENTKRLAVLVEGTALKDKTFRYKRLSKSELSSQGHYITANLGDDVSN